jgi:hypothetical protein
MLGGKVVPMADECKRVDEYGRAFKGSMLQMQIYSSRRSDELRRAVEEADSTVVGLELRSPLESASFLEHRDQAFLDAVGLGQHSAKLSDFWPGRGPRWDGLGIFSGRTVPSVVLFEAKSWPGEMCSDLKATSEASRNRIQRSLETTCGWLGASRGAAWTVGFYQYANRLAQLYFLKEVLNIDARLVNIYFLDDQTHKPTSRSEWVAALTDLKTKLGLAGPLADVLEIFMPAKTRDVLVSESAV